MERKEIIGRMVEIMEGMTKKRLMALLDKLEEKPARWKRLHQRKRCLISVDFDTLDYSNTKYIRNLSSGGVFIETGEPFSLGQTIYLWFTMGEDEKKAVKFQCKVTRRDKDGIGVEFGKLNRRQRKIVKALGKFSDP